jgi:hypothetical protein
MTSLSADIDPSPVFVLSLGKIVSASLPCVEALGGRVVLFRNYCGQRSGSWPKMAAIIPER